MRWDDRAGTPLQDDLQAVHVPMLLAAPHEVQTRPATEMHLAQYHQQYNTHTHPFNGLWAGLPRWAGTRRNICPLTPIRITTHPLSTSSIYYYVQHHSRPIYVLDSPFPQPLSRFSLVFLLSWDPLLHFISNSIIHVRVWLRWGFTSHSTHNRSFRRHLPSQSPD